MEKKSEKTVLAVCVFILSAAVCVAYTVHNFSKSVVYSELGISGENFIALNRNSVLCSPESSGKKTYVALGFTQNQIVHIQNMMHESGAAIRITVKSKKAVSDLNSEFGYGFLTDADFTASNRLKRKAALVSLVKGSFKTFAQQPISLSVCLDKNSKIPAGVFFYSSVPYEVLSVKFTQSVVGWSREENLLFAFSSAGGTVADDFSSVDFTDAASVFSDSDYILPAIKLSLSKTDDIGTYQKQTSVRCSYGNENLLIRRSRRQTAVLLQTSAFSEPFAKLSLGENADMVRSVLLYRNEVCPRSDGYVLDPIPTDLGLIVEWPRENWRTSSYELFEWEQFPGILFFDFADYKTQSRFLTRLAYFVEKAGYKGTLVGDDFVENRHGYNAHDYKSSDLAAFFSEARRTDFTLNESELLLRDILLHNKIIIEENGMYSAGSGAIVSISRESPLYLRRTFVAHESWHGIYFIDENFRNAVSTCYYMFDPRSMEFLQVFWETQNSLGYDRSDEYLMQNEFMAYIMQQAPFNVRAYFLGLANRGSVNVNQPELAAYVRETNAEPFVQAADFLNSYAFDNWGLAAGRVHLISRL